MKNSITLLLLVSFVTFVPSGSAIAQSSNEFRVCAICAGAVPRKNVQLPCSHPVCTGCLQPWLDKKVICIRCQEKKQRSIKMNERWKTAVRVGIGGLIGLALIGLKKLDDRWGQEGSSLANIKTGNSNSVNPPKRSVRRP